MVLGDQETVLYGKGYIEDTLCGLHFRISPKSFYQVNPEQAEILYRTAIDFAELTGEEIVLDAYCGTGTIGLIAAGKAAKVIGVENNASAVFDARANAKANGVGNAEFVRADATEFMKGMVGKVSGTNKNKADMPPHPDVIIMDPPRAGATEEFLKTVATTAPARVVYVSCNMETLARDLQVLKNGGYQVEKIQPVDLFPWTAHVECVVLMSKVQN